MELKQKSTKFLFLIFAIIFLLVYLLASGILQLKSYNILTKLALFNKKSSTEIALVVIDDKSLQEIGRWPWKREYYLEIFDYFENYTKAKLIGYDGLILAPDVEHPQSDKKFFSQIGNFKKLSVGYLFLDKDFEKNNNANEYETILNSKNKIKVIDKRSKKNQQQSIFKSFSALQKEYFKNTQSLAFLNTFEDKDGYTRKIPQLINYKNSFYPSFALEMYSKYSGIEEFLLTDKYIYGFSQSHTLKIPIKNENGIVLNNICFYESPDETYSHEKFSASDIIKSYRAIKNGQKPIIAPENFENKVIFIGANAQAQALSDLVRTPLSENFSGLEIQATNFDNLINNKFFKTIDSRYNLLICAVIFTLVFIFVSLMPIIQALLSSLLLMLLYLTFVYTMFYNLIAIDLILPELFILVALGCAYSYKYLIEGNKKEKIQKAMSKYLSYDVMQNVVKNIDNISLGGKRTDVTILFADIRNFTSISENMDANSTTAILNEYFSALVPIIEEHNGVLNKFMGDAILAIFGEPQKTQNHALDAVKCADKMLKKVKYLQEKWLDEGKPKIEMGIGISSGEAFIGNIGSQERLEYTVIGDTVNTASRIENYNKVYKTHFLISESTYNRVRANVDVITIKNVSIRGKSNRINIYEVLRLID